jgi:aminopeptidase-like protein
MHRFAAELFPVCRSITGDGLRETLRQIAERIPLQIHEVPTGTQVLDWTVPREWNIRDAYIKDRKGNRVVDFAAHNLHVLNYSIPVRKIVRWSDLKNHLYTLPDQPDLIPYRTSYYVDKWGFCLPHRLYTELEERGDNVEYEVAIESTLDDGALSYGEFLKQGELADEVLLSCHVCHPSLANDNLSGIALATEVAALLSDCQTRYSYRFLFIPGTIGSITWLSRNNENIDNVKFGLVLSCVGDRGDATYKRSRSGDTLVDRAAEHVLSHGGGSCRIEPFIPYGYDERQYCSPGYDLAVGCLMRTPNGQYPQYHTSADNLELIAEESLADSLTKLMAILDVLEGDKTFLNLKPKGEPQLGKRGLYRPVGGMMGPGEFDQMAILWVLNQSDGAHSLLDIAEQSGLPFDQIRAAADALAATDLLSESKSQIEKPEKPG